MATIQFDFIVEMQGGSEHKVIADQRDLSRWEVEPFGTPFNLANAKPITFSRYLAWRAMRRAKLFSGNWEQFEDACVEVRENGSVAGADVDPGEAAPPAAP